MKIIVINGPNLNLLGVREPEVYGSETLQQISQRITDSFSQVKFEFYQSNIEGELVNSLQQAVGRVDGVVLNAGGYTHTSVAIRDAISGINLPVVEVHMTNIAGREEIRHNSMITAVCVGSVIGFGADSYTLATHGLIAHLSKVR